MLFLCLIEQAWFAVCLTNPFATIVLNPAVVPLSLRWSIGGWELSLKTDGSTAPQVLDLRLKHLLKEAAFQDALIETRVST